MPSRCFWALPLMALTSCAFANITVTPPMAAVATNVSGGNHRTVHVVVPLADNRPIHNRCGMQKNGYNMDTANVNCSAEPAQWLADLMIRELKSAGFNVVTSAPSSPNAVKVEGQLLQFFVEPKLDFFTFTPEADIHVRLVASSQSGLLAERDFYVKGIETSFVGFEYNFQAASDKAVNTLIKNLVAAVVDLMDRYPDLGAEHASISNI